MITPTLHQLVIRSCFTLLIASTGYQSVAATKLTNYSKATGNKINNLNKIYKNSEYVEFYYNGSEKYSGMDWRAMRLVFDDY